jgi:cyclopropane fatty-acyl-phospholipid synthase-like methyltransferase
MSNAPTKEHFEEAYTGEAPWDIAGAQPAFVAVADKISGSLLDAGCGTGEHSLYFAQRGCKVTGVDYLAEPIERAKRKAAERNIPATFLVKDTLTLAEWSETFDNVIDSGLFHVFEDDDRKRYVAGLAHVLKPGGKLFLMCFSELEPPGPGPRRVTQQELKQSFAEGWKIDSITASTFQLNPKFTGAVFSMGGPKTWFLVATRG